MDRGWQEGNMRGQWAGVHLMLVPFTKRKVMLSASPCRPLYTFIKSCRK